MDSREILDRIVVDYSEFEEVAAIVLGGSSAANLADEGSDYDIYIYCTKEPDVKARRLIAAKYADKMEIDNHYFETGDVYVLRDTNKPIDIMYRSIDGIESNIKWVWEECNACLGYTTCFVDNVNKSEILFDRTGWFAALQNRTRQKYPDKLAENIINKNFAYLKDVMFSFYDQLASAVSRNDLVSVNHRTSAFLASYFDIIFALNEIFHPGEKRMIKYAQNHCKILPDKFEENIRKLLSVPDNQKLVILNDIIVNLKKILPDNFV